MDDVLGIFVVLEFGGFIVVVFGGVLWCSVFAYGLRLSWFFSGV